MMNIKIIFREMKIGIKETSKYILSHHEPKDYYKCYLLKLNNKKLYFCSRCTGIYIGIIIGLLLHFSKSVNEYYYYYPIIIFPIFTLIDWSITAFTNNKSTNFFRRKVIIN